MFYEELHTDHFSTTDDKRLLSVSRLKRVISPQTIYEADRLLDKKYEKTR